MQKRSLKGSVVLFITSIMFLSIIGGSNARAADSPDKITYNRYNIVLVTDTSGSMNSTDNRELRFEAIGKFVALLAEQGNRMGMVVFNGDIAYKQDLIDANGNLIKHEFIENAKKIPAKGYTNIGKGLKTAVEMLNKDKNPDLPSIILLLSDGNTDLETNDEKTLSLQQKADAIQAARDSGYKIYTISLNADGTANSDELSQIAKATNGQFQEVKKADDLDNVFNMYYALIFSSKLNKGDEKTFPPSGEISGTFEIPSVGIEEVNIVMSGKATDYSLSDSSGKRYSKSTLSAFTYASDTYNIIKIVDPIAGKWNYQIKGISGDKIQINIVYNTNIYFGINVSPKKYTYMANDKITINGYLRESGKNVLPDQYGGFKASLLVTDGQNKTESFEMVPGTNGFEYVFAPPKKGTYTVRANIVGQDYNIFTDNVELNVGNTPPKANKNLEETVKLWPFLDNKKSFDLSPCATDAQDHTLKYEVESTAFMDDEYTLQGSKLTMNSYSLSKGSFKIRAYDSDGAYCTFNVTVKTINITLISIILLAVGILLALTIIGIGLWIALNKRFMGACYVTQFDNEGNYYEEVKREKGRGRIPLSSFNLKNSEFNTSKCYIQATGKNYVFLYINKKVYGDGKYDKKFMIDGNGYEVTISSDKLAQKGIKVKFVSRLNNTTYTF